VCVHVCACVYRGMYSSISVTAGTSGQRHGVQRRISNYAIPRLQVSNGPGQFLGSNVISRAPGAHHPLCPGTTLGIRHPIKKKKNASCHLADPYNERGGSIRIIILVDS